VSVTVRFRGCTEKRRKGRRELGANDRRLKIKGEGSSRGAISRPRFVVSMLALRCLALAWLGSSDWALPCLSCAALSYQVLPECGATNSPNATSPVTSPTGRRDPSTGPEQRAPQSSPVQSACSGAAPMPLLLHFTSLHFTSLHSTSLSLHVRGHFRSELASVSFCFEVRTRE